LNIKICGIATGREAESAISEGADLLGFIFQKGPRRIDPRLAREIIRALPEHVKAVGVFRNQPLDEVKAALRDSGAPVAQLNGTEPPDYAAALGVRVVKTFAAFTRRSLEDLSKYDSYAYLAGPGSRGAVDADWAVCAKKFGRVMISAPADFGQLHELIHRVRPWGIDVSGFTDPGRIAALVSTVRAAEHDTEKIRVTIR
jgi:phosphoribosylanthranilate isomerase